jgi:HNH endonuclease
MSRSYVPKALRDRVARQARYRCGYCLTQASIIGTPMEIEHIIPEALGGPTIEDNLWLACSLCNDHKGDRIAAPDPLSGEIVRLFDPRHQVWADHFVWADTGARIVGLTPVGRATTVVLNLKRPSLVVARRAWISVGWHPPTD